MSKWGLSSSVSIVKVNIKIKWFVKICCKLESLTFQCLFSHTPFFCESETLLIFICQWHEWWPWDLDFKDTMNLSRYFQVLWKTMTVIFWNDVMTFILTDSVDIRVSFYVASSKIRIIFFIVTSLKNIIDTLHCKKVLSDKMSRV